MDSYQQHPYYNAKDVRESVTALQVAQEFGHVQMASRNQSNAAWRGGDNPTAVLYNEDDGTFQDFVKDTHGDAIDLYMLCTGASFVDAVNALGDRYCPTKRLEEYYGAPEKERKSTRAKGKKATAATATATIDEPPLVPPPPLPTLAPPPAAPATPAAVADAADTTDTATAPTATAWEPVNLPKNHYETLLSKGYKVVKEWPYTDKKGNVQYYVVRLENGSDKEILQRSADGSWKVKEEKRLLYNLPAIVEAHFSPSTM